MATRFVPSISRVVWDPTESEIASLPLSFVNLAGKDHTQGLFLENPRVTFRPPHGTVCRDDSS